MGFGKASKFGFIPYLHFPFAKSIIVWQYTVRCRVAARGVAGAARVRALGWIDWVPRPRARDAALACWLWTDFA